MSEYVTDEDAIINMGSPEFGGRLTSTIDTDFVLEVGGIVNLSESRSTPRQACEVLNLLISKRLVMLEVISSWETRRGITTRARITQFND